jgi:protein-S-isoprenylcysteine O-methyltransferase Ste14
MSSLELKIPPPAVLILCGTLAWVAATALATPLDVHGLATTVIATVLVVFGIVLATAAILTFRQAQTTVDPMKPDNASSLVTSGVFRFTRNPMYVALLLVLSGWVIYLGSVVGVVTTVLFVAYITRFQIRPEERILALKFGKAYTTYCNEVKRWI